MPCGSGPGRAADRRRYPHPAAARGVQQAFQFREAGLGCGVRAAAAHDAEEPAQFVEAAQCARPDVGEAFREFRRGVGDLARAGLCLDSDHRHVVGHDVVQFAGDALAFGEQGALALEAAGLLGQLGAAVPPGPDDSPAQQGDGGQDGARTGLRVHDDGAQHRDRGHAEHEPALAAHPDRVQAQAVDEHARDRVDGAGQRARADRRRIPRSGSPQTRPRPWRGSGCAAPAARPARRRTAGASRCRTGGRAGRSGCPARNRWRPRG